MSLQSSFSWFFAHSSGKKLLQLQGLICGNTESYTFTLHPSFHYRSSILVCTTRTVSNMGILLHILLAVIVSDAFGRKHLGRWALILGGGCSIMLDIPSFFYDSVDIFDQLHAHNWSHSLFGITLYMLILSGIAFAQKKSPILYLRVAGPVFCTHLYFDISTTNGVMLLFPISLVLFSFMVLHALTPSSLFLYL